MGRHPVFSHGAGFDGASSSTSSYDRTRTSTWMRSVASTRPGSNRRTTGPAAAAKSCRSNGLCMLKFIINASPIFLYDTQFIGLIQQISTSGTSEKFSHVFS